MSDFLEPIFAYIVEKHFEYTDVNYDSRYVLRISTVRLKDYFGPFCPGTYFNSIIFQLNPDYIEDPLVAFRENKSQVYITGRLPYYVPMPLPSGKEPGNVEEDINEYSKVFITNPIIAKIYQKNPSIFITSSDEEIDHLNSALTPTIKSDEATGTDDIEVDLTSLLDIRLTAHIIRNPS